MNFWLSECKKSLGLGNEVWKRGAGNSFSENVSVLSSCSIIILLSFSALGGLWAPDGF